MSLGNSLFNARKKSGLSQEEAAEKLGVSRQTISKWELNDIQVKEIEEVIAKTSDETRKKIDWTQMWAQKYPVLTTYQQQVKTEEYVPKLQEMLSRLKRDYGYGDEDAFLVLKDILAQIWNSQNQP